MADLDTALDLAKKNGFTHAAALKPDTLILMPEVREMCLSNSCGMYDKNWSCPPGCGTLEECQQKVSSYHSGILVQTMSKLEDCFDYEAMMKLEILHKENFMKFRIVLADY